MGKEEGWDVIRSLSLLIEYGGEGWIIVISERVAQDLIPLRRNHIKHYLPQIRHTHPIKIILALFLHMAQLSPSRFSGVLAEGNYSKSKTDLI